MTAVMTPITASGGGGGTALAQNVRGRGTVVFGASTQILSFVAGTRKLRGFAVEGEGDAFVWIEVDGVPLDGMAARHTIVKEAYRVLPNPEVLPSVSSTVALWVRNDAPATCTFEAVVFAE